MNLPPTVTQRAFDRLAEIGADAQGKALRIAVEGGGCSGFQYEIDLDEPRDDDLILEGAGQKVVVDCISLPFLANATAGGLLSGKYRKGEDAPADSRMSAKQWRDRLDRWDSDRNWAIVDALRDVAKRVESSPAAVALAWLLQRPTVTSVIIGVRNLEQLEANLTAAELELPADALKLLDEASAIDLPYPYDFIQQVDGRW